MSYLGRTQGLHRTAAQDIEVVDRFSGWSSGYWQGNGKAVSVNAI